MRWDNSLRKRIVPPHNDMPAVLAAHSEAQPLQRRHHLLPGDPRQFAHTAKSSASSLSSGTGRPSARKTATEKTVDWNSSWAHGSRALAVLRWGSEPDEGARTWPL